MSTTIGRSTISIADRTNRRTPFKIFHNAIAADGSNFTTLQTQLADLETATAAMIDGAIAETQQGNVVTGTYTVPAASTAVRSSKLSIHVQDTVSGKKGVITLATPKATLPMLAGVNRLDLAAEPTATFVTKLTALMESEDGSTVIVNFISRTGRALG